ncbi:MAG TPA: ATP-binding protein [Candidatus Limnocylindria bacterium]|nr:ATP-binding protein [Candidatus Limnocylindria bacterium]
MTATELISLVTQALFVGLFLATLWQAVRRPSRSNLDTLLLFGSITGVVVGSRLVGWLGIGEAWAVGITIVSINVAPLAMIRLVDDFSGTPPWIPWLGVAVFVAVSTVAVVAYESSPRAIELVLIAWFLLVGGYAAASFAGAAARSRGITRRRMAAVAVGAVTFIAAIVLVLVGALVESEVALVGGQLLSLASAISFFLGFAPPGWIRRAWREPDLRQFLQRSIHLASLTDERKAIMDLQAAVADTFGATGAAIGVADPLRGVLRYARASGEWLESPDDAFIGGRAFTAQRRIVTHDAAREDPEHASTYQEVAANTVIAAPITLEDRRVGVLTVFASRAPIFIEDDMWLLDLLADQTGVLLEARALNAEEASLQSREEAARLKEEFLSAAAHDLRTPLTVVLGQAELLERRTTRDPAAPADAAGIARIAREARRLRDLVSQLLDVQRLEKGAALMELADVDVWEVVSAVQERFRDHGLDLRTVPPEVPLVASVDRMRIEQVLDNLIENAIKYTTNGRLPEINVGWEGDQARIAVIDSGVGIPEKERERIFERFYRGSNVENVTDTGMGLGLYICRRIVEGHGGRIWAQPTQGGGTTFVVTLPARPAVEPAAEPSAPAWPLGASGAEAAADA